MKKALFASLLLLLGIGLAAIFSWNQRAALAAGYLHRRLGVPVTIESLDLTRQSATIGRLAIGNPSRFLSPASFTARSIDITSTLDQLRSNPLLIDEIVMDDLFVNVENQKNGDTNWTQILAHHADRSKPDRHYLIKTLILRNLNVQVTQANGETKSYPAIAKMEFHNISDETGFPVDEIEKAIFNQMMQDLYKKLDLEKMIQPLIPGGKYIPKGVLPNLFK
jgi:hypothetical protein